MSSDADQLDRFAEGLRQDVLAAADLEDSQTMRAQAFTERVIGDLCDSGDLDDGAAVYHRSRGVEVSGYATSDDDTSLDLFTTIYTGAVPPATVAKADIETHFKRLIAFLDRALDGYYTELEPANPAFDMAQRIHEMRKKLRRARLFCFTDGLSSANFRLTKRDGTIEKTLHLWDLERLYRAASSGSERATIDIDFISRFGSGIQCLADDSVDEYRTMLAIVPGRWLAELYGLYGSRLLEFNVRSFLQARGKVNKGIRKTIIEEPRRFLAYNNGISATASEVVVERESGCSTISKIKNLQIVNGGQTTASLYHARRADDADLSKVAVQMKLTIVEPALLSTFVPLISRYANTQNKVNEADFSANDTFHIQLEAMSRAIWAPAATGTQRQTHWFYERARGQYQDLLAGAATRAQREQLKQMNPTAQKFTKTDLAKFENTFAELPHVVSRGAEKNFREFVILLSERAKVDVDQAFFQRLVARAIAFRRAEKLIGELNLGGYRANLVTYTLALVNHRTAGLLDLDRIWREQAVGPGFTEAIQELAPQILAEITARASGRNITEWCKREECWHHVASLSVDISPRLFKEVTQVASIESTSPTAAKTANMAKVVATPPETWKAIARWSGETQHLMSWQRSLCESLARILLDGRRPSDNQAIHGVLILAEAARLGFKDE